MALCAAVNDHIFIVCIITFTDNNIENFIMLFKFYLLFLDNKGCKGKPV